MKVNERNMVKELGKKDSKVSQERGNKDKIIQLFTKNTALCGYRGY